MPRVEIVRQALKSKSQWWRKCPIQISHEEKPLLETEKSFALFAEGSAAKEQWYIALSQGSGGNAKQAVEDAYAQFCRQTRRAGRHEQEDYPQVVQSPAITTIGFSSPPLLCTTTKPQPRPGPSPSTAIPITVSLRLQP